LHRPPAAALARLAVATARGVLGARLRQLSRHEPGPWEPPARGAGAAAAGNGAIYQAGYDVPLFENAVARRVGDT
jgi:hypothetical protein